MSAIKIGKRRVGCNAPCFIIAEAGVNHNNSLLTAKRMIEAAVAAGCDAVKFQAFKTSLLYSTKAGRLRWKGNQSYDIFKANKRFELPLEWIPKLNSFCAKQKVIFLSSAFDEFSADALQKAGVPAFKIASSSITNTPLLQYIANKKKPTIISTGAAAPEEIREAVDAVTACNKQIALLHCHLQYPTPLKSVNMSVLKTMHSMFPQAVIGYSDHTAHPYLAPVAAVAMGAKIIEKHITLDKKMPGPDHFFALEPKELRLMVEKIRQAEKKIEKGEKIKVSKLLLGKPQIKVYGSEKYLRDFVFQTVMSVKNIGKGERFAKRNIMVLRPGNAGRGIEPKFYPVVLGKRAKKPIRQGVAIKWNDIAD